MAMQIFFFFRNFQKPGNDKSGLKNFDEKKKKSKRII